MADVISRSLSGYFCDDIRRELSGKVTLVGCYEGDLEVAQFPAMLPKLCAAVRIITPFNRPLKRVHFKVTKDDEVLIDGVAELEAVESGIKEDSEVLMMFSHFVISPLQLDAPCIIRVRADVDGEELSGLGLVIRLAGASTA